jgi:hypothetical protein
MVVLGIDVGKSELYACLLRPELKPARQVVANTAEGHTGLQTWLETQGVIAQETSVVMEATGVYWERRSLEASLGRLPGECGQCSTNLESAWRCLNSSVPRLNGRWMRVWRSPLDSASKRTYCLLCRESAS